ncbi:MAG: RNA 3'-phosphate cyclase [Deltaproteobacteria bacterium]|nr:RNA 3'-phosphate cyclase [Deltaproteobacteria bacterium]
MIAIDGSQGEGGGQILRTALSLSALLTVPVTIENIRANRPKSGLRPQHLTAVKALQEICGAEVEGLAAGSRRIVFRPGRVKPGPYFFDVGTAGAVTLIVQALLLPLALAAGPSRIILRGGTHVPWSPPYHYLSEVYLPTVALMGIQTDLRLKKWGWYPKGGGEVEIAIQPTSRLMPLVLDQPWEPDQVQVRCATSNLPGHIRERERGRIQEMLETRKIEAVYDLEEGPAVGQGNLVFITARKGPVASGFSALGAKGKPAEQVAEEAAQAFLDFLDSGAAVDGHLGDQLLPYLALAPGRSTLLVQGVSSHLRTNLWVINQFLPERLILKDLQGLGKITTTSPLQSCPTAGQAPRAGSG